MLERWYRRGDDPTKEPIPTPVGVALIIGALVASGGIAWWRMQPTRADEQAGKQSAWVQLADEVHRLRRHGRHAEALRAARASVELAEEAYGPTHPALAEAINELAQLLVADSRFDGVEAMYARAIEIQSGLTGP